MAVATRTRRTAPARRGQSSRRRKPPPARGLHCPICGDGDVSVVRPQRQLAEDLSSARESLGSVVHAALATVFGCNACRCLFRDPRVALADSVTRYRDEHYPEGELERLRSQASAELSRDREWLEAHGVSAGASLLEIGSYTGALLEIAREQGCSAVGVD